MIVRNFSPIGIRIRSFAPCRCFGKGALLCRSRQRRFCFCFQVPQVQVGDSVSIANFRFGWPCAGWGLGRYLPPEVPDPSRAPLPGCPAATYAARHPFPGAHAAGLEAGGWLENQSWRESARSGSTYCRVGGSKFGSVSCGPEPGPEVCAGREACPSHQCRRCWANYQVHRRDFPFPAEVSGQHPGHTGPDKVGGAGFPTDRPKCDSWWESCARPGLGIPNTIQVL
jgi:hypothetical protein